MKTNRREFVSQALKAAALTTIGTPLIMQSANASSPYQSSKNNNEVKEGSALALQFSQVALPYAYAALEPSIDTMTMEIHYTKHHAAYVKNVNEAIAADAITFASENDFFANVSKLSAKARNNGGGVWNHNFFWESMKPGNNAPTGKIADALNGAFTSFDKFKEQFTQAAMTRFGSGWAWLILENGKLKIGSTPNQDNPLMDVGDLKGTPLLAIDVWEHAYYLKYQNKRNEYVSNWWNVVDWNRVAARLIKS